MKIMPVNLLPILSCSIMNRKRRNRSLPVSIYKLAKITLKRLTPLMATLRFNGRLFQLRAQLMTKSATFPRITSLVKG